MKDNRYKLMLRRPHIPYTYLIGWSVHNKWYYGCQFGQMAHPDNLWCTYFTSSKYVHQFRTEYGEPDIIQVRHMFREDPVAACIWEKRVLARFRRDPRFLNANHGNSSNLMPPFGSKIRELLT